MHVQTGSAEKRPRTAHPVVPELVGGVPLTAASLRSAPEAAKIASLAEIIANAEYWLSFDVAAFEPHLAKAPSPLRELGIGIALRYSDAVDGRLSSHDIAAFRSAVAGNLPDNLRDGIGVGLATLERLVAARDALEKLHADGFAIYRPQAALSVHALRASGRSTIRIDGDLPTGRGPTKLELGRAVRLEALDERSRPLDPPAIEGPNDAPVLAKTGDDARVRLAVFLVPGWYRLRVPGRAEGDRRVLAT